MAQKAINVAGGDGTVVSAGSVGEVITSAPSETTTSGIAGVTLVTLPLTKGSWVVTFYGSAITNSGTITIFQWSGQLTTDPSLNPSVVAFYTEMPNAIGNDYDVVGNQVRVRDSQTVVLDLASDTTYYVRFAASITGGGSVAIKGGAIAVRKA